MKKKFLNILIAVAIIGTSFTACNSDKATEENTDSLSMDSTAVEVDSSEAGVMVGGAMMVPSKNIVENAVLSNEHTTLVAAVTAADLVETLSGEGPFTVFAPTDDAFAKLPAPFNNAANIGAITDAAQITALSNILRYHVLGERYFGWDFGVLNKQTTLADAPKNQVRTIIGMPVGYVKGNANAKYSKVEPGDILCTNGVIHVIGDVLLP